MNKLIAATAAFLLTAPALASGAANAGPWMGHLARLQDAQAACRNLDSAACLPYLAEAVAIASLLEDQAYPIKDHGKFTDDFAVPFYAGSRRRCPRSWVAGLNGESLLHQALAIESDGSVESFYWSKALLAAAQQGCTPLTDVYPD
jgi:hypothetical protein